MRAVDTRIDPELLLLHLSHLYDIHYKQDLTWTFHEYYRGLRWSVPSTEETQTFGGNSWPSPHSLEFIVFYLKEKIVFSSTCTLISNWIMKLYPVVFSNDEIPGPGGIARQDTSFWHRKTMQTVIFSSFFVSGIFH